MHKHSRETIIPYFSRGSKGKNETNPISYYPGIQYSINPGHKAVTEQLQIGYS